MKRTALALFLVVLLSGCRHESSHPRIYVTDKGKAALTEKINSSEWAESSLEAIKNGVDEYVDRHETDPEWIISRMQMYWDTHHERVYVIGNDFSHGTGRAPVPTVKFQGHRDPATDYAMPSLEDTMPYMDEKGMYVQNMGKEGHPWEWVHPSKTGRMIGPMNERIMALAAQAAFLYWYSGEEKYAVFASDIFMTYIRGMHHRREPFALEQYGNSHLMGLATFEVILDGIIPDLALCYDFLYHWLRKSGEDIDMVQSVFKRFADQEIMYGVPDNNWNIFQARFVTYLALALESDSHYEDGKGRQYYLNEILNNTTIRQFALREAVVDIFDKDTAMWPESATYSMSVCKDILDIISLIENSENNGILDSLEVIKRAVPATVEYLFPNGRVTSFGDAKYVPLNAHSFEMLISLYRKNGEEYQEKELTRVLQKMIDDGFYNRGNKSMFSLFFYVDRLMDIPATEVTYDHLTSNLFHAPNVSWLIQRNGNDPRQGMAATLVGSFGNHAHANGISLEVYAKGLMLAPETSFRNSYSTQENREYFARFPAHNTVVVDGISDYPYMRSNHPYELLSSYPTHGDKEPLTGGVTYARVSFTEPQSDAVQQRLTSIVRVDETTGYLVDIFHSARPDGKDRKHDYFYHGLGQSIDIENASGDKLNLSLTGALASQPGGLPGYNYFNDPRTVSYTGDFMARFNVDLRERDDVFVDMWMKGYPGRTIFTAEAPPSNALGKGAVPDELVGAPLPTLVVRQQGEAWNKPFVSVIYPYAATEERAVSLVDYFGDGKDFTGIVVNSAKRTDYIFSNAGESAAVAYREMQFEGDYAVVSVAGVGPELLFLGRGKTIGFGKWIVSAENGDVDFSLRKKGSSWEIDTTGEVRITIPATVRPRIAGRSGTDRTIDVELRPDGTYTAKLPTGKYEMSHNE